jgi:hypothetical protein
VLTAVLLIFGVTCTVGKDGAESSKGATKEVTPREIAERVRTQGAAAVVSTIFQEKRVWNHVLQEISSGNRAWLQVAADLRKGSDAGASGELELAAADALKRAPDAALEILEPEFTLEILCGNEESLADTLKESLQIIDARRKAVSGVKEKKLQEKRNKCLTLLDNLEKLAKENADTWFGQ